MSERVGIYPGSFDPIHLGHVDLIERSRGLFDKLYVAVLNNEEKAPLFTVEERVTMIRDLLSDAPECRVERFSGLLVDFAREVGAQTIVRGLRAISDFEYEFQMALMNRRLDESLETVFLMPKDDLTYVSSRLIKEVCSLGGQVSGLLPGNIESMLIERLRERSGDFGPA